MQIYFYIASGLPTFHFILVLKIRLQFLFCPNLIWRENLLYSNRKNLSLIVPPYKGKYLGPYMGASYMHKDKDFSISFQIFFFFLFFSILDILIYLYFFKNNPKHFLRLIFKNVIKQTHNSIFFFTITNSYDEFITFNNQHHLIKIIIKYHIKRVFKKSNLIT